MTSTMLEQLREERGDSDPQVAEALFGQACDRRMNIPQPSFDDLMKCVQRGTTDQILLTALEAGVTPTQYGTLEAAIKTQEAIARKAPRPRIRRKRR